MSEVKPGQKWLFKNGQELLIHPRTNARNIWYSCPGAGYYAGYITWMPRARFLRECVLLEASDE